MVTFGDAHWAELIRPQRWAGVRACPPRRQGKARCKMQWSIIFPQLELMHGSQCTSRDYGSQNIQIPSQATISTKLYEVFAVLLRHICNHVFPFVFHHCKILQVGCFDSIVLFVNNILTYSLGFDINMCRTDQNLYGVSFCL